MQSTGPTPKAKTAGGPSEPAGGPGSDTAVAASVTSTSASGVGCFEHLMRFFILDVPMVRLTRAELKKLGAETLLTKYLVWRRAQLLGALPFLTLSVMFSLSETADSASEAFASKADLLNISLSDRRYIDAFAPMETASVFVDLMEDVCLLLVIFFASLALWRWMELKRSSRAVSAVLLLLAFPYLCFLVPYRHLVDFDLLQTALCEEALQNNGTELEGLLVGGEDVAELLRASRLPATELCADPNLIGSRLESALEENGVLYDWPLTTCPLAQRNAGALDPELAAVCQGQAEDSCGPCGDCMSFAAAFTASENDADAAARADRLRERGGVAVPDHCVVCATTLRFQAAGADAAVTCLELCAEYFLTLDPVISSACFSRSAIGEIKAALAALVGSKDVLRSSIGASTGVTSMAYCLPASLSLLWSSIKSARVLKLMISESRFPGYLLWTATVFSLPLLVTLLVFAQQAVGDLLLLPLASLLLIVSVLAFLPLGDATVSCRKLAFLLSCCRAPTDTSSSDGYGLLEPQPHDAAAEELMVRARCALASRLGFVVLGMTFALNSETVLLAFEFDPDALLAAFMDQVLTLLLTFLSVSKVSTVFFTDTALAISIHQHMGDSKDDADTQRTRSEKFEEFRMAFSRDNNQDSARVGGQAGGGAAGGGAAAGAAAGGAEEEKGSTGSMAG